MAQRWTRERLLILKAVVLCGGTTGEAARYLTTSKRAVSKAAQRIGICFNEAVGGHAARRRGR